MFLSFEKVIWPKAAISFRLITVGGALSLLSACTHQVKEAPELVAVDTPFGASGSVSPAVKWWVVFEDPPLTELIQTAFEESPDLLSVWERLQVAEALARRERAGLFPELDGFFGGQTQRADGQSRDFFEAGLAARYEVDLWGRIRSEVEAEQFRVEAEQADYEAAAITLAAEVALTWYRLVAGREVLRLIEAQIDSNSAVVDSLLSRFRGGDARSVDVLRQERLLESTRELKLIAQSDIAITSNRLKVLTGRVPQLEVRYPSATLPRLPELPATGLPSALVLRRPDLQAAYLRLLAADRDLASAIADRYPRIDLTAGLRSSSEGSADLFEDWTRSLAGDLIGPILDGGRRSAEVDRNEALKRLRLAEFSQLVLLAYREVEDALIRERTETLRISNLERQIELEQQALEQLQREFLNGFGNFIDALAAQTNAQQLQRELIESKLQNLEFRIALHRAIAGSTEASTLKLSHD